MSDDDDGDHRDPYTGPLLSDAGRDAAADALEHWFNSQGLNVGESVLVMMTLLVRALVIADNGREPSLRKVKRRFDRTMEMLMLETERLLR